MGKYAFKMLGLAWIAGGAVAAWGQSATRAAAQIVREIDDPPTGRRWVLERDPSRPGGPGRLVPVDQRLGGAPRKTVAAEPVIRPGDHIIVEQNTRILDARLEAVALNPAAAGSPLQVRLVIGGRVVHALALGPGRAQLVPGAGRP